MLVEQTALTETAYTVVRLLQRFDALECMEPPGGRIRFNHTLSVKSGTGVLVRLREVEALGG